MAHDVWLENQAGYHKLLVDNQVRSTGIVREHPAMVSTLHESLVEMFRERPTLAAEILAGPLAATLPEYDHVHVASGDLTTLTPTEFRADAVITFTTGNDDTERSALAVIVEIQLRRDDGKKTSWPTYITNLHARHNCPVVLLVLCTTSRTATWAAEPIELGPGSVLTPLAVGPDLVPLVTDHENARQHPELAVLSALTHGRQANHRATLDAVVSALETFDQEHAFLYAETMMLALPMAARRYLEAQMTIDTREPKTEFFRRWRDQSIAEGQAQGLAQGRTEGQAAGEARAILTVLTTRGINVSDDVRERINSCTDLSQLEAWIQRAVTIMSIDELFTE